MAWSLKGQIDYLKGSLATAMQDYDQAVRLVAGWAPFYVARGLTWDARGDRDSAIRDYTQATILQPDLQSAHFLRGVAFFCQGHFAVAAEDFAAANRGESDLHGVLWHYIARQRAGLSSSKDELAHAATLRKPDAWPMPIFQMFQGQRNPDAVVAATTDPRQRCEAQFYGGEWQLLQGNREGAARGFEIAAKSCPSTSLEYRTAVAELKAIGQPR